MQLVSALFSALMGMQVFVPAVKALMAYVVTMAAMHNQVLAIIAASIAAVV